MPGVIRDAREADLHDIVRIYNAAIPGRLATADTEPVTEASRRSWLVEREDARYPVWVMEREGRVVGWLSMGRFHGRPAYAATAEVGLYVDPGEQRRGVGRALLAQAISRAPGLGLSTLLALVFAHNAPSLALCQTAGFAPWGRLPGVAVLDGVERDLIILGLRAAV